MGCGGSKENKNISEPSVKEFNKEDKKSIDIKHQQSNAKSAQNNQNKLSNEEQKNSLGPQHINKGGEAPKIDSKQPG